MKMEILSLSISLLAIHELVGSKEWNRSSRNEAITQKVSMLNARVSNVMWAREIVAATAFCSMNQTFCMLSLPWKLSATTMGSM